MDVSIIIASYNTRDILRKCLATVARETQGLEYEVIVVDNHSSDGSVEMMQMEFPWVQLIRNGQNRGFAAAQNIGIMQATGAQLLILNSDVFLLENAVVSMRDELRMGPNHLAAVGPQILNPDYSVAPSARRAFRTRPMVALGIFNRLFRLKRFLPSETWVRTHYGRVLGRLHDNYAPHDEAREVDFVDGMCVLVKREALREVGLFDEQFFFDYEIIDLANRLRAAGWRIRFTPRSRVIHQGHASRKKFSQSLVETFRSELIYCAKYTPDRVPFVQCVTESAVRVRLLLLGWGVRDCEARELCRQILLLSRNFDHQAARRQDRVPRLNESSSTVRRLGEERERAMRA